MMSLLTELDSFTLPFLQICQSYGLRRLHVLRPAASGFQIPLSKPDFAKSAFKVTKSGLEKPLSGSDIVKSDSDLTKSKRDLTKSDSDLTKSGFQVPLSGSDIAKSDFNLTKSKPDLTKSDSDFTKSEPDFVMSGLQKRWLNVQLAISVFHFEQGGFKISTLKRKIKTADGTG
jgi:hypothetical protein